LGYTVPQLYAIGGAAFLIVGVLWGLLAVAMGRK